MRKDSNFKQRREISAKIKLTLAYTSCNLNGNMNIYNKPLTRTALLNYLKLML